MIGIEKILKLTLFVMILTVSLIIIFITLESLPVFVDYGFLKFISGLNWNPGKNEFGVLPMIVGSVCITGLSVIISAPLSISCAIYLEEIASKNMMELFKPIIQTLAGIPSVIYGFFGLTVVMPIQRQIFPELGFSILAASIILAIMISPTIISVTQDAINSVSTNLKEASLGLGSTRWQTIKNIILPVAAPGIITAVILAIGRAVGETLAVLMLAGNVSSLPSSVLSPVRTLTSNIALEMGYATGIHYNALFATAAILLICIMSLMIITNYISKKWSVGYES